MCMLNKYHRCVCFFLRLLPIIFIHGEILHIYGKLLLLLIYVCCSCVDISFIAWILFPAGWRDHRSEVRPQTSQSCSSCCCSYWNSGRRLGFWWSIGLSPPFAWWISSNIADAHTDDTTAVLSALKVGRNGAHGEIWTNDLQLRNINIDIGLRG